MRNHVRFSPMPAEPSNWRLPNTSPSSRSSLPMPLDLDPRPSSEDLINNANPNLNGIDPARARWSQKGTQPQPCCGSIANNIRSPCFMSDTGTLKVSGGVSWGYLGKPWGIIGGTLGVCWRTLGMSFSSTARGISAPGVCHNVCCCASPKWPYCLSTKLPNLVQLFCPAIVVRR